MRLTAAIQGDLKKIMQQETRIAAQGVQRGVNRASGGLQRELRRQVKRAGLGQGLEKAWRKERYPRRGDSMRAAGLVFSKATRLHRAFSADRIITANRARYLAIPLPPAVANGWDKRYGRGSQPRGYANIEAAQGALGPLGFVPLAGDRALLVHKGVAYFLLLRQVRLRKRLDIERPAAKWGNKLPDLIVAEMRKAERRAGVR